jgi:hypothetical protein
MPLLRELNDEIRRHLDREGEDRDEEALLRDFRRAARELLARQTVHVDDRAVSGAAYRTLWSGRRYFEALFDSLGYQLRYVSDYGYVLLLPGEIATGSRRGRIRKDETLVLLALRVIWDELSRVGEMDDYGRVDTETDALLARYRLLGRAEQPKLTRLREMLADFAGRGIVRLGEEDRDELVIPLTVMPVIRELVTAQMAAEVTAYAEAEAAGVETGGDVLDFMEAARRAAPASREAQADPEEPPAMDDLLSRMAGGGAEGAAEDVPAGMAGG